jgi:hypothetical protein
MFCVVQNTALTALMLYNPHNPYNSHNPYKFWESHGRDMGLNGGFLAQCLLSSPSFPAHPTHAIMQCPIPTRSESGSEKRHAEPKRRATNAPPRAVEPGVKNSSLWEKRKTLQLDKKMSTNPSKPDYTPNMSIGHAKQQTSEVYRKTVSLACGALHG